MLQRLFPTKQKEEERHRQAVAKIIFLATLALSVVVAYFLINSRKDTDTTNPLSEEKTLGEETIARAEEQDKELAKNIAEGVDTVKNTAEYLRGEIETTTEDVVTEGKKYVEDTSNELLYSATLKPIVAKIEDLPEAQQEQLRKQICPQPQE